MEIIKDVAVILSLVSTAFTAIRWMYRLGNKVIELIDKALGWADRVETKVDVLVSTYTDFTKVIEKIIEGRI